MKNRMTPYAQGGNRKRFIGETAGQQRIPKSWGVCSLLNKQFLPAIFILLLVYIVLVFVEPLADDFFNTE